MKALLLILLSLILVNCGNKKFTANQAQKTSDQIPKDDDQQDDDDNDDQDDDDDLICPRYDLIIKSTHTSNKKLNFTYTFNAEMTHKSTKGKHKINFAKAQYNTCSGNYTNTTILTSLVPLQVTEDLTDEVVITDGAACVSSARETTFKVLDAATNEVLFNEKDLKDELGCEFGYSAAGKNLRKKLIDLADGVANAKGTACD